jgi:hypothetical protein
MGHPFFKEQTYTKLIMYMLHFWPKFYPENRSENYTQVVLKPEEGYEAEE